MSRTELDSLIIYRHRHRAASVIFFLFACGFALPAGFREAWKSGAAIQCLVYSVAFLSCALACLIKERCFVIDRAQCRMTFIHRSFFTGTLRREYTLDRLSVKITTVPAHMSFRSCLHYVRVQVQGDRPLTFISDGSGEEPRFLAQQLARDLDAPLTEDVRS